MNLRTYVIKCKTVIHKLNSEMYQGSRPVVWIHKVVLFMSLFLFKINNISHWFYVFVASSIQSNTIEPAVQFGS